MPVDRSRPTGFCPVNGVLVVLPIDVAEPGSDQDEIARACRTAYRRVCCLSVAMSGLDDDLRTGDVAWLRDLVKRLPPEARKKQIGQRFPLVPELAPAEVPDKVEARSNPSRTPRSRRWSRPNSRSKGPVAKRPSSCCD